MPLFINAYDVIATPYDYKIFKEFMAPLKIIESLACARPVVACNVPEFKLWFKGIILHKSYQRLKGINK